MGREILWNVGVLVVVFRKQVGSYRSLGQGRKPDGRREGEEQMKRNSPRRQEARGGGKKTRGGPQEEGMNRGVGSNTSPFPRASLLLGEGPRAYRSRLVLVEVRLAPNAGCCRRFWRACWQWRPLTGGVLKGYRGLRSERKEKRGPGNR